MMKIDPVLEQDILIGQYTLGLLTAKEAENIQTLLSTDAAAARCALEWEENFLGLADALPRSQPPAAILEQILSALDLPLSSDHDILSARLPAAPEAPDTVHPAQPDVSQALSQEQTHEQAHDTAQADVPNIPVAPQTVAPRHAATETQTTSHAIPDASRRLSKTAWMGGVAIAAMIMILLTLIFLPSTPAEPPVVIVEVAPTKGAILLAPGQSSTPGWVVTVDLENNITLTPKVHTETAADTSVQLWTYNETLPQPRSLGLIDPNQPVAVPASLMGEVSEDQFFEMTLEPEGGSPTQEPSGPILFIGRVVTFSQ